MCFNCLLIHDFGGDIAKDCIGKTEEFQQLGNLRNKLAELIKVKVGII